MADDIKITEKINEKLVNHPNIEAGDIWVNVDDGNVTIAGSVSDEKTKELTKKVVKRIDGVNEVQDLMETIEEQNERRIAESKSSKSDVEVKEDLKLQRDAMTNEGGHDKHYVSPNNGQ